MTEPRPLPRWSLAFLSGFFAIVFGWAAYMLPWQEWTTFSIATGFVAAAHAQTFLLAAWGHKLRRQAWRGQAVISFAYLGYMTWNLVTSSVYIAELYGGLGRGVAVALGLVWCIVAGLTIPLSVWGIAVTGGLRFTKAGKVAAAAGLVLFGGSVFRSQSAAAATPTAVWDNDELQGVIANAVPFEEMADSPIERPSLMTKFAAPCVEAPAEDTVTLVTTYLAPNEIGRAAPRTVCFQGASLDAVVASMREQLAADGYKSQVKVDLIMGIQPLEHVVPVVDGMTVRPGLDGICDVERCFMPWQLLAIDAFKANKPIPVVPELRFGIDPVRLRKQLAITPDGSIVRSGPIPAGIEGLVRIETASFVIDREGDVHRLRRMREDGPELNRKNLADSLSAAELYVLNSQLEDGRFEYRRDPFTGQVKQAGFSIPRQAGTTLALCELATRQRRARKVARASLRMLASVERVHEDIAGLAYPAQREVRHLQLGSAALSAIAFLACRPLVGDEFDGTIDRLTRFLLRMQRPNGSFYPKFSLETGAPVPGPDPLYAVGQAVFALTLLEKASGEQPGIFVESSTVRDAVEGAMKYTAEDYWQVSARKFFFMEENWHCLAARASLGHHRHEGYEDFCIEYVRYKTRLILAEEDRVDPDLIGGYGFGNVLLPHNTGSGGFGEAMSAALAIQEVRGQDDPISAQAMRRALAFLLHHQWDEVNCFACTADRSLAGSFSENMASPEIRIDYVQHSMAGMGHGGRILGLVDGKSY